MKKVRFDQKLEASLQSLKNLRDLSRSSPGPLLAQSVEECSDLMEQLNTAGEELRRQNEEMAATRQALEDERQRYKDLFEFAPDGYFILTPAGVIREANRAATTLFSVSRNFLKNNPFSILLKKENLKKFYDLLAQATEKEGVLNWQGFLKPPKGEAFPALVSLAGMYDQRDKMGGLLCMIRNLTESLKIEGELREARNELEKRVEERTADLVKTNKLLQQEIAERKNAEESLQESEKRLRYLSSHILNVQENERKRVSQEIHDGIGQYFSAVKYRVEDVLQRLETESLGKVRENLKGTIPIIQEAIEEVRKICSELRPLSLDTLGILATISWVCRDFQYNFPNIHCSLKISVKESEIPASLKIVIYRIVQEALSNVAKHSGADSTSLSLRRAGDRLVLEIEDNGQGYDQNKAFSIVGFGRGLGLASMKERANLSDGKWTIRSAPGAGTRVRVEWKIFSEK